MITFLNSRDWQLRAAFFRCVPCLAAAGGNAGIEDFLLPCCLQVMSAVCLGHLQMLNMLCQH